MQKSGVAAAHPLEPGLHSRLDDLDDGILAAIGNTPLIRLRRLFDDAPFRLYAKLEALNPGGSIKDRPALAILREAIASGEVGAGTVIIESSSGNMGIGLAQVCRYLGLRFICVVDAKTSPQNIRVLLAYGAEVEVVSEVDPDSGELLQARINRVKSLRDRYADSFWPNQYAHRANPSSHYRTTMSEVAKALDGKIDYLFVATSTCGTIRGCADFIVANGLDTRTVAVDALGSRIFAYHPTQRSIPGLGAGLRPDHLDLDLIDEAVHVDDLDCIRGCRLLLEREAVLAGGSSGGVVAAIERLSSRIPDDAVCVAILPDRGDRYLDTVYSDDWVEQRFGTADAWMTSQPSALRRIAS
jgi:N-(2-amino-2-carboxyethyl)-L-glutamate synthase